MPRRRRKDKTMNKGQDNAIHRPSERFRQALVPILLVIAAALAGLKVNGAQVHADEEGYLMVPLQLGGSGNLLHWGLVVGHKEMRTPPPLSISGPWEARSPLAPGAYIWLAE